MNDEAKVILVTLAKRYRNARRDLRRMESDPRLRNDDHIRIQTIETYFVTQNCYMAAKESHWRYVEWKERVGVK